MVRTLNTKTLHRSGLRSYVHVTSLISVEARVCASPEGPAGVPDDQLLHRRHLHHGGRAPLRPLQGERGPAGESDCTLLFVQLWIITIALCAVEI